jgi:glycosyltransferase involved in cell wall biosynthesis
MQKIRVLEIIGDASLSGAPRHLLSLVKHLNNQKFEVVVALPPGPIVKLFEQIKTIETIPIPMRSRWDLTAVKIIRKIIKLGKFDLIHTHGTRAGSLGRMSSIGFNLPLLYTEHLWTAEFHLGNRILDFVHHLGMWIFDHFTTSTIAVSEAVKNHLLKEQITRPEKIVVIYNGVNIPAKPKRIDHQQKVIGFVGSLTRVKGVDYLIAAFKQLLNEGQDVRLEIVGTGPEKQRLKNKVKMLEIHDRIKFIGYLEDLEQVFPYWDIYVQPSLSESFGISIAEAMSYGLPVVATSVGGVPELVDSHKTGYLVPPKDAQSLAKMIKKILIDPEKSQQMGQLGRQRIIEKFSIQEMVDQTEQLYQKVVEESLI